MFAASQGLRDALARGHTMTTQVDVIRGAGLVAADIDVIAPPAVSATLTTTEGRSCTLKVSRQLTDAGLLNPLSDEVIVRTGVPGVQMVPIFTGRVDARGKPSGGDVGITCMSRSTEAFRAALEQPFASIDGASVVSEIRRCLQDVNPGWGLDPGTVSLAIKVPAGLAWEDSRERALSDLCVSAGCLLLPDRVGSFVLVPSIFAQDAIPLPVITLTDGENGVLVKADEIESRQDVVNSVTVIVERTDGSPPIRVTARDMDAGSPTGWGGLFGKQSRVIKVDTPISEVEAGIYAHRVLRASLALARSWHIEIPHQPLLDPGDVIGVTSRGEPMLHLVESVDYAGAGDQPTVLATRLLVLHGADITEIDVT
jgi:hypothetical protein